jgi:hypothetical protein
VALLVIRLDAEALENADLDLRYEIPDLLEERSNGLLSDRGYTHEWDTDALLIFLATSDLASALSDGFRSPTRSPRAVPSPETDACGTC